MRGKSKVEQILLSGPLIAGTFLQPLTIQHHQVQFPILPFHGGSQRKEIKAGSNFHRPTLNEKNQPNKIENMVFTLLLP